MRKYLLFTLLGFMPVGMGVLMLLVGMGDVPFSMSIIGWPIFLFLWGVIGYFIRKIGANIRLYCIMMHLPMFIGLILSFVPNMSSVIEETLLIVIMSTGFWSVLPRFIINELWFFFLFYLIVMVLCCYAGIKLADWKE